MTSSFNLVRDIPGLDKGASKVPNGDDRTQTGVQTPVRMVVKANPERVTQRMMPTICRPFRALFYRP